MKKNRLVGTEKVQKEKSRRGKEASLFTALALLAQAALASGGPMESLYGEFKAPPKTARPGVYWYFMDGNLSKEGMTRDLESMREVGIGYVVFLEVAVGVPRGKVPFMSPEWIDCFRHAVRECERLDIQMFLGTGPGWTGSGGPWVKGAESMRHLVSSEQRVTGGKRIEVKLPVPPAWPPYFGTNCFPPKMLKDWNDYYEDVAVLAFPAQAKDERVADAGEKAHYFRIPYSSRPNVKPFLPSPADARGKPPRPGIDPAKVVDLTASLKPDGTLVWEAPPGEWTVMRFGARNNGSVTRPAPVPGLGMECDKFSEKALLSHFSNFTDRLLDTVGGRSAGFGGLKYLHIDSWEMNAQNWTDGFREEFRRRRGYDPQPYYPAYGGRIVANEEVTERFLWDLRRTSQELIIENHAGAAKRYAHKHGMQLSCEPYDMNPIADLELAAAADVPMAEFWCEGFGFNTSFAPIEATSAAHLIGQCVVPAESFTAGKDGWRPHPGSMKNQTDWALAMGVNRMLFHTFQHQCLSEDKKPGMTMGMYGVHWDRNQTWWPMAGAYHTYLARCQHLLQQGRTVADVLYLIPEGSPHVFRAPASALVNPKSHLPDRRGYAFDACPPSLFLKATAEDGELVFPGGARYRLLVLPDYATMTPKLLGKVRDLALAGVRTVGKAPVASPSLQDYPACDDEVRRLAAEVEKKLIRPSSSDDNLYPRYEETAKLLADMGVAPDFVCDSGVLRHTHRTTEGGEIYFVASRAATSTVSRCTFRTSGRRAELWDALSGRRYRLDTRPSNGRTEATIACAPHQSWFVVFPRDGEGGATETLPQVAEAGADAPLSGAWKVTFRPPVGAAFTVDLPELADWSLQKDERIRYFSGIATYEKTFDAAGPGRRWLFLGRVANMARVRLNGHDLGVQWTDPWRVEVTEFLKPTGNVLEIEVANLWTNRLVGDERRPKGTPPVAITTWRHYTDKSPLEPSGLLGPVRLCGAR